MLYFWKKIILRKLYFTFSLVGNTEKCWVFICLFKW